MKIRIIVILILYTFLIIFVASYYLRLEHKAIKTERFNDLKAIAELKTNQLVKWHAERLSEAIFFSNNEPLIQSILKLISGGKSSEEYIRISLTHILSNNRYENIFILNPKGELLFNLDSTFVAVDSLTISLSNQAIEQSEIIFTDFYDCRTHNSVHYDIIAPMLNAKGEVFATMVFRVNPEDYLFPLIQDWPTPSKTAETLLVRKDGDSAVFINTLRHVNYPPLTHRISLSSIDVPAVKAIQGFEGIFEGVDYRGYKVLSALSSVPNTSWFMVAKVDKAEIFKVLYYRTGFIIAITVLLIIAAGATLAWFYHYRQRNIFKKLLESERELHQSQEEFRATLYSIGDGVITTDSMGVVKRLNPIAEDITGWKEIEAMGKKLEEVFNIVNEETRERIESPVSKVLKEGAIVGLANHTLLISRGGKEIPIADSGAPIRDRKGDVVGVVMVFRDQTEERKQQNIVKEREEQLNALITEMQLGMAVHKMIFNAKNEPIDYRFLNVNPAFEKHTGLNKDDILGKTVLEVLPNTEPVWIERFGQVVLTGEPITFENYSIELGKYFSVRAFKSQANQFAVLFEDITQRKIADEELIEREAQYRNLANSSLALIWTSGVDKLCNYFNETWLKFTGRTFEQEQGNGWAEGIHPNDFDRCLETYVTAFDKQEPFEMEYQLRHVSGDYRIILDLGTPNFNSKGEFIGYIGHCFDITERKLIEDSIRENEKKFRQLVDSAPQGIFVQTNLKFAYINPIGIKLFGAINPDQLIGKPVLERFHLDYRDIVEQRINKLNNEQQRVPNLEETYLKIDGTPFDVAVSSVPLNYQGENGVLVFFQDISQRKKADNELVELKNDLEQKVIEKTKELNERIADLERFHEATIDREYRMKELRDEIKRLKGEL